HQQFCIQADRHQYPLTGASMRSRHRQSGLTIVGFVFVAAVVLSIAMIGFRVLPSYIEYFSVEKTLRQTLTNARDNPTLDQLRKDFDLKASPDYTDSVRGRDLELTREGNALVLTASWTSTLHLVGNVSILLEADAAARTYRMPADVPAAALAHGASIRLGEGELKSGGATRPSILADALEAVFGAILLDGGFGDAYAAIERVYAADISGADTDAIAKDPKTLLQEWLQARHLP